MKSYQMRPGPAPPVREAKLPGPGAGRDWGKAWAYAAILLANVLWGVNYTFAKLAVEEIDPFAIALIRVAVVTPLFFAVLAGKGEGVRPRLHDLRLALPLGLTGILANQTFFIVGIRRTTPAHSSIVVAMLPVVVLILASLLIKERITRLKLAGILMALSGIILINLQGGFHFSRTTLVGDLLTFCGICGFSYYTVAGRSVVPRLGVLRTTALSFLCGGILMIPMGLPALLGQSWSTVTPRAWGGLTYVVLVSTFVCYLLFYRALASIESGKVATVTYLQPVVAGTVSHLVLGEVLGSSFFVGALAILSGVYLAERG